MKAYMHTGPRGKFIGVADATIYRVIATSTHEIEVGVRSDTGPQAINLRLSQDEAKSLANRLLNALKDAPTVV